MTNPTFSSVNSSNFITCFEGLISTLERGAAIFGTLKNVSLQDKVFDVEKKKTSQVEDREQTLSDRKEAQRKSDNEFREKELDLKIKEFEFQKLMFENQLNTAGKKNNP